MRKWLLSLLVSIFVPSLWAGVTRTVAVTGSGKIELAPNVGRISYSIINEATKEGSSLAGMVAANRQRVEAAKNYIESVVGSKGSVEITPVVERQYEYSEEDRKNHFTGYRVVTSIQVKLEGRTDLQERLNRLFDSSKISADEVSQPVFGLSDRVQASAEKAALRKAVKNGLSVAKAQLEPGESLGRALERGDRIGTPGPYNRKSARAAALSMETADAGSAGQAIIQAGKVTVEKVINFVYEVLGTPSRLNSSK